MANKTQEPDRNGSIISTVGSSDLSAVLDGIGSQKGLHLEGDVTDLAGLLNSDAAYEVGGRENTQEITSSGDWGYYAKQIAGAPGQFLKSWIRWNAEEAIYDYFLEADANVIFSHETPYVGTLF